MYGEPINQERRSVDVVMFDMQHKIGKLDGTVELIHDDMKDVKDSLKMLCANSVDLDNLKRIQISHDKRICDLERTSAVNDEKHDKMEHISTPIRPAVDLEAWWHKKVFWVIVSILAPTLGVIGGVIGTKIVEKLGG